MLSNLAWLGADTNVYTPEGINGQGFQCPKTNPNAWWLDEEGKLRTINDLQNLNLGAWLGDDGEIHTVNDDLMNLKLGAWLGEDGDVHTVNDLQNLKVDVGKQITQKFLEGVLINNDGTGAYATCLSESKTIQHHVNRAIESLKKKNLSEVNTAITSLINALKHIPSVLDKYCSHNPKLYKEADFMGIKDINRFEMGSKKLSSYLNQRSSADHIGKDTIGMYDENIYQKFFCAVQFYEAGEYDGFGKEIGTTLASLILDHQMRNRKPKNVQLLLI